jgi:hypothetical protein
MDKATAYKHLANLRGEFAAGRIDDSQLDSALWSFLEVLAEEVRREQATPRPPDPAAAIEALRSEVAEIRAMLEAMASPPAYRVDTATAMPPAW